MDEAHWLNLINRAAGELGRDQRERDELKRRFHHTDDHGVARAQFLGGASDRVVGQLIRRAMVGLVG